MNTVCDHLSSEDNKVYITSGSFGEGLEMRGSDIDIMFVLKRIEVHEKIKSILFNPTKTYFTLMTKDTKPGFAMLRLISSQSHRMLEYCETFRKDNYLSNALFRKRYLNEVCPVEHGPCVSDTDGLADLAHCLHSTSWVKPASGWISRSNESWPNENTKKMITNYGVLFVPIGAKGSPHEEFEWRMSFSVGEKFLIFTFSHTQLLCYALMKILLKDVINADSRCKDLICSYYLKTIIFWISEETQPSVWTPDNLIPCFMRCFSRLIYCVQYQVCPHYFIPENNMFENKIEGLNRDNLIDTLRVLFSYGWQCILFPKQISPVQVLSSSVQNDQSFLYYDDLNQLLKSSTFVRVTSLTDKHYNFCRSVHTTISCNSKKLKFIHEYFMSWVCNLKCQSIYVSSTIRNKNQYKQHKTCLSYLLMSINHDTVSVWLMLASLFYKEKQYNKCVILILYALSKCTIDKLIRGTELSVTQRLVIKWYLIYKQGVVRSLKFVLVDNVIFATSAFIPLELLIVESGYEIPPIVYAHFMSFLCHYHMNNMRECRSSLRDLQLTIAENYFMGKDKCPKALSYYCLGTSLQLMGENVSAKLAFIETVKLLYSYPFLIKPLKRLSMTASM
ncbi:Hypothetical predicted protein [Mytilus galloprovincialis]|uniref:Mab-21-like HhH/H2TH-like domain-containing protein n=1 Tax=Mytilus galloprovincialis TaxID=29158 RepID=A0A8B6EIH3_MYTGA|nr:Hypothetical predicted protein [Mytilus galloprovincialis]VDI43557.1 Hypothetical predicted protein [Mytilus galloprovincialis]